MAVKELDRVVVTRSVEGEALAAGDVGVVVHVYADGRALELEVFALDGRTLTVATVPADAVRPAAPDDVLSVRSWAAE